MPPQSWPSVAEPHDEVMQTAAPAMIAHKTSTAAIAPFPSASASSSHSSALPPRLPQPTVAHIHSSARLPLAAHIPSPRASSASSSVASTPLPSLASLSPPASASATASAASSAPNSATTQSTAATQSSANSKKQKYEAHFGEADLLPPPSEAELQQQFNSSMHPTSQMEQQQPAKVARRSDRAVARGHTDPPASAPSSSQWPGPPREPRGLDETSEEESIGEESHASGASHLLRVAPSASTSSPSRRYAASTVIRLNVGGHIFETTLQTLTSRDGTYFSARFTGQWSELASPHDGAFFIDRDPTHFRHILTYLRDGEVDLSDFDSLRQLRREASFYQLADLANMLDDRIREINISHMRLDESRPAAPSLPAAPAQSAILQQQQQGGFMTQMFAHPSGVMSHAHRNLWPVSRPWGLGGMGGAGPTLLTAGPGAGVHTFATASAEAQMQLNAASSSSSAPALPTRTNSCPNRLDSGGGVEQAAHAQARMSPHTPLHSSASPPSQLQQHVFHAPVDDAHMEPGAGDSSFEFSTSEEF